MIITLWWRCGAWKSTIAKKLVEWLWYEVISIWWIKRKLAEEMGITILEFDKIWWENPEKAKEFDLKYEEYQQSLDVNSKIILDSRLGFYCQPKAFKVFVRVDDRIGAERIYWDQRTSDENKSIEAVIEANRKRHEWQQQAYIDLYWIDLFDKKNYDLVVDSSTNTPDELYDRIVTWLQKYV